MSAHVARLYFEGELTKQEIARRLRISRFKVARLLEQARAEGVVQIEIRDPVPVAGPLARALEAAFGLELAVIVPHDAIPNATAGLLPCLLGDEDVLGVAWGATLAATAEALAPIQRPLPVVQICGAVPGVESGAGPTEVALRCAERLGGEAHPLPAPAFASRAARDELIRNEAIRPTVALFDRVTLALVGIGKHERGGHVLVHAFDRDGVLVDGEMSERAIAMSADQLRSARVIAAAGGAGKEDAVRGAVRTGLIEVLVTDERCAEAALA